MTGGNRNQKRMRQPIFRKNAGCINEVSLLSELEEGYLTRREKIQQMVYFSFWNYTYLWGLEHIDVSLQEVSVVLAVLIVSRAGGCVMGLTLEA